MVTPTALTKADDSKSSEEEGSKGSILMKRVSSMRLLMTEYLGYPIEPSSLVALLTINTLIFPL